MYGMGSASRADCDGGNAIDINAVGFCGCAFCNQLHAKHDRKPRGLAERPQFFDLAAMRERKKVESGAAGGSPVWKSLISRTALPKSNCKPLSKLFLHFSLVFLQLLFALLLTIIFLIANKSTASGTGWPELLNTTPTSENILIADGSHDCIVCPDVEIVDCV